MDRDLLEKVCLGLAVSSSPAQDVLWQIEVVIRREGVYSTPAKVLKGVLDIKQFGIQIDYYKANTSAMRVQSNRGQTLKCEKTESPSSPVRDNPRDKNVDYSQQAGNDFILSGNIHPYFFSDRGQVLKREMTIGFSSSPVNEKQNRPYFYSAI